MKKKGIFSVDNDTAESLEEISDSIDSSNKNNLDEHDDIPTNCLDKTIVKAVVKAMQIMENTKASQNSFQDILDFGKESFCEGLGEECDMDIVNSVWPSSWEEAQVVLRREGYENPKECYVCFCRKKARRRKSGEKKHVYGGKWDIMQDKK